MKGGKRRGQAWLVVVGGGWLVLFGCVVTEEGKRATPGQGRAVRVRKRGREREREGWRPGDIHIETKEQNKMIIIMNIIIMKTLFSFSQASNYLQGDIKTGG